MPTQVVNLLAETVESAAAGTRVVSLAIETVEAPVRPLIRTTTMHLETVESTGFGTRVVGLGMETIEAPPLFSVTGLDVELAPDDGGVVVTATGRFPQRAVTVDVTAGAVSRRCYSGVLGQGDQCVSADRTSLEFVVPPMPVGGPYALTFTDTENGQSVQFTGITYVQRTYETNLYSMRAACPPPRAVGPLSIEDET